MKILREEITDEELREAISRGWGHSLNAHKEMDADLADAIAFELMRLLIT